MLCRAAPVGLRRALGLPAQQPHAHACVANLPPALRPSKGRGTTYDKACCESGSHPQSD
jgi:hypothetical protein